VVTEARAGELNNSFAVSADSFSVTHSSQRFDAATLGFL
jgi:hypothetical protein